LVLTIIVTPALCEPNHTGITRSHLAQEGLFYLRYLSDILLTNVLKCMNRGRLDCIRQQSLLPMDSDYAAKRQK
jgi:hypothetical protein